MIIISNQGADGKAQRALLWACNPQKSGMSSPICNLLCLQEAAREIEAVFTRACRALLMARKTLKLSTNTVSNLYRCIFWLYTMTGVQTQSSPLLVLFVCAPDNFLCALLSNKLRLEWLQNVGTLQRPCGRRNGLVKRIQWLETTDIAEPTQF